MQIFGADLYDQLWIEGAAHLGGWLNVVFGDGYHPQNGDRFTLLRYASLESPFSGYDLPDLDPGLEWWPVYGSTSFTLYASDENPVPEPATWLLLGAGLLMAGAKVLSARSSSGR